MVAREDRRHVTVEEWRELLRASHEAKYEYIDGAVYLMAGGSLDHARIGLNAARALEDALGDGPCRVYNSDAATRLSPARYTFPDVSVTCDPADQGAITEIQSPRVIVEVTSDSTEAYDRGVKFKYYRACPTVQEYVLVATRYQAVEIYRRTSNGWTEFHAYDPDETVHVASIDVRFPAAALYRRTTVPRALDEAQGEV